MTLDQKIQIWNALGTWVAGVATLFAVVVALYLARRAEKVRLKAHVGLRLLVAGDGTPAEEHLYVGVTNVGERTVTINSIGWSVGKGRQRRFAIQQVSGPDSSQYPIELAHGKTANFMVSFVATPDWPARFAKGFIRDPSDRALKTLVALIYTSVGHTAKVRPEKDLLERLKKAYDG